MALWLQLQQLDSRYLEQVDQLYDDTFPMEIRQYLSHWIESQDWDTIALDDSLATVRFSDLLSKLDEEHGRLNMGDTFLFQHNIRKITRNLQDRFQEYPTHMAMIISKSLNEEKKILASAMSTQGNSGSTQSHGMMMEKHKQLDNQVNELNKSVQEAEQDIPVLEDLQDEHDFKKKSLQSQMEVEVNAQTAKEIKKEELTIQKMCITLNKMREVLISKLVNALKLADQIHFTLVSEEIPEWKQRQQMACIGGPPNACLDQLQNWFTSVAKCLQQIQQQLSTLQELVVKFNNDNDPITVDLSSVQEQALSLFKNLLMNSIVVERQPCMPTHPQRPLVLKTHVKFTVKLRLLVKLPELNYKLKVKASIDKDVTDRNVPKGFRRFNILGTTTKVMNMEESNGCLAAEFQHLQLKESKPVGTKAVEPSLLIMEELHSISFETQLSQPGLSINITTTSLPVVVISHVSQMPSAWASILWYNMLCTDYQNLLFFRNPPPVQWGELAKVLSWQFSSITKRGLNSEQLTMLADKLLGSETHGNPEEFVFWNKFSRSVANERGGAFWLWIDGILDLIKRCLLNIWNDGFIIGFISKENEKNLLQCKRPGTFLLRFSETCKEGGITITWVEHSSCGEAEIHSVRPYTKSDLMTISFPDIIRNYTLMAAENIPETPLHYLYPDIPKDNAFGRYYSRTSDVSDQMEVDKPISPYVNRKMISVSDVPETRLQDNILPLSPEEFGVVQYLNKNNGMDELAASMYHQSTSSTSEGCLQQTMLDSRSIDQLTSNKLTKAIADWIAKSGRSIEIVEDEGLRDIIRIASNDLTYELPSRANIEARIQQLYESERVNVMGELKQATAVSLTGDPWMSTGTLRVTAHYIDKNWKFCSRVLTVCKTEEQYSDTYTQHFIDVSNQWNIKKKTATFSTDGTWKVMGNARQLPFKHITCTAYSLQSAMTASLQNGVFESVLTKCRKMTEQLKRSPALQTITKQHNPKSLIQDVPTRWNSTLEMLKQIYRNQEAWINALELNETDGVMLTRAELDQVQKLEMLLEPCRYVTELLGGEKFVSCSVVLPALCHLSQVMESSSDDAPHVVKFKLEMTSELEKQKVNTNVAWLKIATAMDPRFKDLKCLPRAERGQVWVAITNLLKENKLLQPVEARTSEPPKKRAALMVVSESDSDEEEDSIEKCLSQYQAEPIIDIKQCPLQWWSQHARAHNGLASIARKYLATPATSVPCERLFSLSEEKEKRDDLSSENVNQLVCLIDWLNVNK